MPGLQNGLSAFITAAPIEVVIGTKPLMAYNHFKVHTSKFV